MCVCAGVHEYTSILICISGPTKSYLCESEKKVTKSPSRIGFCNEGKTMTTVQLNSCHSLYQTDFDKQRNQLRQLLFQKRPRCLLGRAQRQAKAIHHMINHSSRGFLLALAASFWHANWSWWMAFLSQTIQTKILKEMRMAMVNTPSNLAGATNFWLLVPHQILHVFHSC